MPGSPWRIPSAMNWVAKTDFPVPEAPVTKHAIAFRNAPAHHAVQLRNPDGKASLAGWFAFVSAQPKSTREGLQTGIGNAKGVQTWHRSLPAQFYDLQLTHDGISLRNLAQPEEAIGDGKYRVVTQLILGVFTDQESRSLPACQEQCQLLDEGLQIHLAGAALRLPYHRAKGVHHNDGRVGLFRPL